MYVCIYTSIETIPFPLPPAEGEVMASEGRTRKRTQPRPSPCNSCRVQEQSGLIMQLYANDYLFKHCYALPSEAFI